MHALKTLHATLRPPGLLLDIHPEAEHRWIETEVAGQYVRLGQVDETRNIHDIEVGEAALQAVIEAGLFAIEREAYFTFMTYFDTVERWLTYMADRACHVTVPEELVARARHTLPPGASGTVRMRREIYAARLRKLETP